MSASPPAAPPDRVVGCAVALASALLIGAVAWSWDEVTFAPGARQADAIVERYSELPGVGRMQGPARGAVVRFHHDGQVIQANLTGFRCKVGDTVAILYHADDPSVVRAASFWHRFGISLILAGVGSLVLLGCVAEFVMRRRGVASGRHWLTSPERERRDS